MHIKLYAKRKLPDGATAARGFCLWKIRASLFDEAPARFAHCAHLKNGL